MSHFQRFFEHKICFPEIHRGYDLTGETEHFADRNKQY